MTKKVTVSTKKKTLAKKLPAVPASDIIDSKLEMIFMRVEDEFVQASNKNKAFNSAHEGYAVILEELDELWLQVLKKSSKRSDVNMREECVQIAAMAIRFYHDLL